jgi:HEAT repeat protein
LSNENKNIRENSLFLLIEIGEKRAVEPPIKYMKTNTETKPGIQENKT